MTLNGITVNITQNFYYYKSEIGAYDNSNVSSGAYIFRPAKTTPDIVSKNIEGVASFDTSNIAEFHQKWNSAKVNVSQVIRIHKNEDYVEFDWLVGGIDM